MTDKTITLKDYQTKADIKYSQYLKFMDLIPVGGNIEDVDPEFLTMRILKIFYNLDPKDTRELKQQQMLMLVEKITRVISQPKSPLKRVIEYEGVLYGMIPNFSEITVGELIDLDKQYELDNFTNITSILYRPIVGKVTGTGEYEVEEYKGYSDIFADVGLDVMEGYISFFSKSYQFLNQHTLDSMENKKSMTTMKVV